MTNTRIVTNGKILEGSGEEYGIVYLCKHIRTVLVSHWGQAKDAKAEYSDKD